MSSTVELGPGPHALTLHQPWASLLVHGIKRIEGRQWATDFRGRLWIHAAGKPATEQTIKDQEAFYRAVWAKEDVTPSFPKHYPSSALVGCVDVVDCLKVEAIEAWHDLPESVRSEVGSPNGFLCDNPHYLVVPQPMGGRQLIWTLGKTLATRYEPALKKAAQIGARPFSWKNYTMPEGLKDMKFRRSTNRYKWRDQYGEACTDDRPTSPVSRPSSQPKLSDEPRKAPKTDRWPTHSKSRDDSPAANLQQTGSSGSSKAVSAPVGNIWADRLKAQQLVEQQAFGGVKSKAAESHSPGPSGRAETSMNWRNSTESLSVLPMSDQSQKILTRAPRPMLGAEGASDSLGPGQMNPPATSQNPTLVADQTTVSDADHTMKVSDLFPPAVPSVLGSAALQSGLSPIEAPRPILPCLPPAPAPLKPGGSKFTAPVPLTVSKAQAPVQLVVGDSAPLPAPRWTEFKPASSATPILPLNPPGFIEPKWKAFMADTTRGSAEASPRLQHSPASDSSPAAPKSVSSLSPNAERFVPHFTKRQQELVVMKQKSAAQRILEMGYRSPDIALDPMNMPAANSPCQDEPLRSPIPHASFTPFQPVDSSVWSVRPMQPESSLLQHLENQILYPSQLPSGPSERDTAQPIQNRHMNEQLNI